MKNIFKGLKIVFLLTILAKIASFISELVIAYFLGTTAQADAYSMINGIHIIIYPMLGVGIWSIFLPEYKKTITKNNLKEGNQYSNRVITLFFTISSIIAILVFAFSNQIVSIVAPGFDSQTAKECSILLKIYSPYFVFATISSIYAAMLQSHEKFFGSQIREFVSYLPTIILGPILYKFLGVYGFGIALTIGGLLRLLIQLPFIKNKYQFHFDFNFKNKKIKKMLIKTPSVLVSSISNQIHTLVDKMMASTLKTGSVSCLNYGSKLTNVVNGLFTSSISTILYPQIAKMVADSQEKEMSKLIEDILIILSMVIFPITIFCFFNSQLIVELVYLRGDFDNAAATLTAQVFNGYLIGLYFIGIKDIIDKIFYTLEKNKVVMLFNLLNVIINITLNFLLIQKYKLVGLAYATSISSICYIIYTMLYLHKKIKFELLNYFKNIIYILFVNVFIFSAIHLIVGTLTTNEYIYLLLSGAIDLLVLLAFYKITKYQYYQKISDIIQKKIFIHKK